MNFGEIDDLIEQQEVQDLRDMQIIRRPYVLRVRTNNFIKWNEIEFYDRFRLSKDTVLYILQLIENDIRHLTDRNHAVSPLQQLLITLRFFACGSFQIVLGDFGGLHGTTCGQIIRRVSSAIASLRRQFIKMPDSNEEKSNVKETFYNIANFPKVLGVIDCTHIRIQSPGGDHAENFRNRKGYFSLNVQAVGDANYKIRDIVCRWPGASHDSHIFQNSSIRMRFENDEMGQDVLLGDSGYPLRSYLITPINNPQTPVEQYFNDCQIKTRTIIERIFGIWKRRFPILSLGMRNKLPVVQDIIIATAVLHNIASEQNEEDPPDIQNENEDNIYPNMNNMNYRQPFLEYYRTFLHQ